MIQSIAIEKRSGERIHPCFTPVSTLNGSVSWLLWTTLHSKFSYRDLMTLTSF
ncbi:hypothetical protein DPMN_044707 [Dreissena polymorpha]|uniref:Uncharacterized protein n=1 Tax=Dreissena polymorpha TaxID=45954 RepID=A0A9D4D3P7_DREPO|nr:hypothetical protein DPMN_044707 [Dreissena polymorpha]